MFGFSNFSNQPRNNVLSMEVFGNSETGHGRTTNEDAFLIDHLNASHKLLAVADAFNISGGEEASRLAVRELRDLMLLPSAWNARQRLQAAFEVTSRDIDKHFRKIHHVPPVGTTLSAVYVVGATTYVAHVGNSRVYLVREGNVHQLTNDDTFAQLLMNSGVEPSESSKKTLIQAMGVNCQLAPMLLEVELLPGDYLLLCSDGFSNNLNATDIVKTLQENASLQVTVERLIETADERDGEDNITVILARVCRAAKAARIFRLPFSVEGYSKKIALETLRRGSINSPRH